MRFEWDINKAIANEKKHKITFEEAATVFTDIYAIMFDDPDHSDDENRFLLLGISKRANLLIVCHCYRGKDDVIRIISAREATKKEKMIYSSFNKDGN